MKSKSADKIKMPSIDELLGVSGEESATDIEISSIHSFANHPFKVLDVPEMILQVPLPPKLGGSQKQPKQ